MSKWIKAEIVHSLIWVPFLFLGHDDYLGLHIMDWWSYADFMSLISIWLVVWAFVRIRLKKWPNWPSRLFKLFNYLLI